MSGKHPMTPDPSAGTQRHLGLDEEVSGRYRDATPPAVEIGALARAAALAAGADRWMDAIEAEHHANGQVIIRFKDGMEMITAPDPGALPEGDE